MSLVPAASVEGSLGYWGAGPGRERSCNPDPRHWARVQGNWGCWAAAAQPHGGAGAGRASWGVGAGLGSQVQVTPGPTGSPLPATGDAPGIRALGADRVSSEPRRGWGAPGPLDCRPSDRHPRAVGHCLRQETCRTDGPSAAGSDTSTSDTSPAYESRGVDSGHGHAALQIHVLLGGGRSVAGNRTQAVALRAPNLATAPAGAPRTPVSQ